MIGQKERRKIQLLENDYIVLKPSRFGSNGQWEQKGKRYYNIRQVYDFMNGNYHCVIEPRDKAKIRQELREEIRRRKENIRAYHESQLVK